MAFNVLWTILLGVLGGIISSLIVSRVFLIQSQYQDQIQFVDRIIRKLGAISAYLQVSKSVFEVDYDGEIQMEREMREKGYKTEAEYYAAHKEKRWISKDGVLKSIKKEIDKTSNDITSDIHGMFITDEKISKLLNDVMKYVHDVATKKEFSFSSIGEFQRTEQDLMNRYDGIIHLTGKTLLGLVLKDKFMIVMYVILAILIIATITTGLLGL